MNTEFGNITQTISKVFKDVKEGLVRGNFSTY